MSNEFEKNILNSLNLMRQDISEMKKDMVTKTELKEELENLKKNMATKEELEDLKKNMATKDDLKSIKRDIRKIKDSINAIIEDIIMLDDRTRPIIKIKNS